MYVCDDISMLVYCVCSHMTGAIWRTSSPFPIDTGLPPNVWGKGGWYVCCVHVFVSVCMCMDRYVSVCVWGVERGVGVFWCVWV